MLTCAQLAYAFALEANGPVTEKELDMSCERYLNGGRYDIAWKCNACGVQLWLRLISFAVLGRVSFALVECGP